MSFCGKPSSDNFEDLLTDGDLLHRESIKDYEAFYPRCQDKTEQLYLPFRTALQHGTILVKGERVPLEGAPTFKFYGIENPGKEEMILYRREAIKILRVLQNSDQLSHA